MITLKSAWLESPLGQMIAIGNETHLFLLEFMDRKGLERGIERLCQRANAELIAGRNRIIDSVQNELALYFDGKLQSFLTPLSPLGSSFQHNVWSELQKIPSGITRSYRDIAGRIGNPNGFRAVANANGANQIAIIIPCHRVIYANGDLGGYGGGLKKKQWLLDHERTYHG